MYLEPLGGMARLGWGAARLALRPPFERQLWLDQLYELGNRSLTITNVTLLFTGMVLALQTGYSLAAYGGKAFVGDIVALSVVRELGPVLTALMVAGRVGAGITAELGSMAVTEQVDALRALAASPVKQARRSARRRARAGAAAVDDPGHRGRPVRLAVDGGARDRPAPRLLPQPRGHRADRPGPRERRGQDAVLRGAASA